MKETSRPCTCHRFLLIAVWLALPMLVAPILAQEGVPPPPGLVPEKVWPAPTAEDWQKPVLIEWQRTWEDAVAVARATKRPILVCINMDGEIASEHYAGIRYRDPDICKLYEPYVCVIASVYRHTPKDHDENGRRIPCPRLGGVTCGEHIAIEPFLFEKFMDGKRISPRHIMVELDENGDVREETYDVFYTWDTESVFQTITDGIANRAIQAPPVVRGDRPIVERVASRDSFDRLAVERAWQSGDATMRRAMLEAALAQGGAAPVEVLRMAIAGLDPDLARAAREGLARARDTGAVDLIADTLRAPLDSKERDSLIEALGELGAASPRARTLATAHRGLAGGKAAVDLESWTNMISAAVYSPSLPSRETAIAGVDAGRASLRELGPSPTLSIELAEAKLTLAMIAREELPSRTDRHAAREERLLWEDARLAAEAAEREGAPAWRVAAVLALTAQRFADWDTAYAKAAVAVAELPADVHAKHTAAVLQLFAEARQDAISTAVRDKREWKAEWMADVNAAYALLAKHRFGTATHVANHYDFLEYFGSPLAPTILDAGLARFTGSPLLEDRWRTRALRERGPEGLMDAARERVARAPDDAQTAWFVGYAALIAAEAERRAAHPSAALDAYARAIEWFEAASRGESSFRTSCEHYVAMALAGRARLQLELGNLEAAVDALIESLRRSPNSAATLDGLEVNAVATARMIAARAREAQREELAKRLDEALATLDPQLLEPPAYERDAAPTRRPRRRG
ncbi:MAG: hypothetical protein AB7I19_09175 [Planctomycetota bacterium]